LNEEPQVQEPIQIPDNSKRPIIQKGKKVNQERVNQVKRTRKESKKQGAASSPRIGATSFKVFVFQ
jgi:hypothetical protein